MAVFLIVALGLACIAVLFCGWLGWQLLRQNGRVLMRLEDIENRLDAFDHDKGLGPDNGTCDAAENENWREDRFRNRSLARSKLNRDGLKAGTGAPMFRLPRLDGKGELGLEEFRGRYVLLVFSSPICGPCITLAPQIEQFHRSHPEIQVMMVSKGEPSDNRKKVKEYGLTFPIVLQQQWEVSRRYAMFATPVAYLIDEKGVITRDIAVGVEPIHALMAQASEFSREAAGIPA